MPDPAGLSRPWIDSYPPGVPSTYHYPSVPLTRFLDDAARDFPELPATTYGRSRLTYADLLERVDGLARALERLGVGSGDRLATILPDHPGAVVALFAAWRLGAVAVPIDPDASGVATVVRATAPSVIVADTVRIPDVNAVRPDGCTLIASGRGDWLSFPAAQLHRISGRRRGTYRRVRPDDDAVGLTELLDDVDAAAQQRPVAADDPAALLVRPDGAISSLGHRQLIAASFQARLWMPDVHAGRERVLVMSHHATPHGLAVGILSSVLAAATIVFPGGDAGTAISRHRPTLLHGEPDGYRQLAEAGVDAGSVRAGLAAPGARPEHLEAFQGRNGARIRETFGHADAPFTHANAVYGRAPRGGIGLPVTDTVAAVVDPGEPAEPLAPGQEGELVVHGPQVATPSGWLATGRTAVMRTNGTFWLTEGGT